MKKADSYSRDDNLWHVSHEGLELEDPTNEPNYHKMLKMTTAPEKALAKAEYVEIDFEKGIPVGVNGKRLDGVTLIKTLNKIGGPHGVGLVDLVENRVVGMKSRGVYETPGGSILYAAHQELEHICLDRQTYSFKQMAAQKMAELIYGGLWSTPLRESLSAFVDFTQKTVTGSVKLKLYRGSIISAGASSPYSLYNPSIASFTTGELYDHADANGFIQLYGLPIRLRALMEQERSPRRGRKAAAKVEDKEAEAEAPAPRRRGRKAASPAASWAEEAPEESSPRRRGRRPGRKVETETSADAAAFAEASAFAAAGAETAPKRRGRKPRVQESPLNDLPIHEAESHDDGLSEPPKKRGRKPGRRAEAAAAGNEEPKVVIVRRRGRKPRNVASPESPSPEYAPPESDRYIPESPVEDDEIEAAAENSPVNSDFTQEDGFTPETTETESTSNGRPEEFASEQEEREGSEHEDDFGFYSDDGDGE
jgi:hypothetical protein